MKSSLWKIVIVLVVVLNLVSCKSITSSRMFDTPKDYEYSEFSASPKEYIIQPYDKITVQLYHNKAVDLIDKEKGQIRFSRNNQMFYNVEWNGKVKLPALGWVDVSGLTVKELEHKLEEEFRNEYVDPFVFVEVVNRRVIVFANGSAKGTVVNFSNENFSLIEALAHAGGISDFDKAYKIKLIRGNLKNPEVFKFDIRNLEEIKKAEFQLLSNDIIYVESRPRYASKLLREITPYLSLLTSVFTVYILLTK